MPSPMETSVRARARPLEGCFAVSVTPEGPFLREGGRGPFAEGLVLGLRPRRGRGPIRPKGGPRRSLLRVGFRPRTSRSVVGARWLTPVETRRRACRRRRPPCAARAPRGGARRRGPQAWRWGHALASDDPARRSADALGGVPGALKGSASISRGRATAIRSGVDEAGLTHRPCPSRRSSLEERPSRPGSSCRRAGPMPLPCRSRPPRRLTGRRRGRKAIGTPTRVLPGAPRRSSSTPKPAPPSVTRAGPAAGNPRAAGVSRQAHLRHLQNPLVLPVLRSHGERERGGSGIGRVFPEFAHFPQPPFSLSPKKGSRYADSGGSGGVALPRSFIVGPRRRQPPEPDRDLAFEPNSGRTHTSQVGLRRTTSTSLSPNPHLTFPPPSASSSRGRGS
jgi:hypothetical protein